MRNLKTKDLFSLSRIVKKMNIKEDIKELAQNITGLAKEDKEKAEQSMQVDIMLIFVENLGSAEKDVYKLLGDLTDKTAKEIEDMDLTEFMAIITELFKQDGLGKLFQTALK